MIVEKLGMHGRVALVVGCGGGAMGTHTSIALAEAGATVVGIDVSDEQVEDTRVRVEATGSTFVGFTGDAQDADVVRSVVAETWHRFGAIHHLVNVVGGSRSGDWYRAEAYPEASFDDVVAFNLRSPLLWCREVAHRAIDAGTPASIVNYASLAGIFTLPYQVAYGAAKAAVINMTRTMAVEWGPSQIRVNAIAPGGAIETPRAGPNLGAIYGNESLNPLGRRLKPEEVSAVALFLLSDLASAITAQTIVVDAGQGSRAPMGDLDRWAAFLPTG